ncbi:MAG: 16S rRNA (cytosine(1402)-N(4))-methyltransferase RsmH [Candidatus Omnitrophota bacterium]
MNTLKQINPVMNETHHYPVMSEEVVRLLDLSCKKIIVDCTLGLASHSLHFFDALPSDAHLIGIDRDEASLMLAADRLKNFEGRFTLVRGDFANLDIILAQLKIAHVDAFFFDLGLSTYQLSDAERGFSLFKEGPLDMRMDKRSFVSAYDLVNNLSEDELENIFRKFGQERYSKRISRALLEVRKREPIATTAQLRDIVVHSVPASSFKYKIHPATRIFQALRIAVNRELEVLGAGIEKAIGLLSKNGRIAVISFHSLEDRIVKHTLRRYSKEDILTLVTKKPLTPGTTEIGQNPASRSAKLRVAEKR